METGPSLMHFPLAARYAMQNGYAIRRSLWSRKPTDAPPATGQAPARPLAWLSYHGGVWFYHTWQAVTGGYTQIERVVRAADFSYDDMMAKDWTTLSPDCIITPPDECDCEAQKVLFSTPDFPEMLATDADQESFDLLQPNAIHGLASCSVTPVTTYGCDCPPDDDTCPGGQFWNGENCIPLAGGGGGNGLGGITGGGTEGGSSGLGGGDGTDGGGSGSGSGGGGGGGGGNESPDKSCPQGSLWDDTKKKCVPVRNKPAGPTGVFVADLDPTESTDCTTDKLVSQGWLGNITFNATGFDAGVWFWVTVSWLNGRGGVRQRIRSGESVSINTGTQSMPPGTALNLRVTASSPYGEYSWTDLITGLTWPAKCEGAEDAPATGPREVPGPYEPPEADACTEGQHWDFATEACVDDETCGGGEEWDATLGACRATCGSNASFNYSLLACVCNPGYADNGSGCEAVATCDANEHYDFVLEACVCDAGFHDEAGICVPDPDCGANEHWDSGTAACVCDEGFVRDEFDLCNPPPPSCGTNEHWDSGTSSCVCDEGFVRDEFGACVTPP